jgi:hypothetical protein
VSDSGNVKWIRGWGWVSIVLGLPGLAFCAFFLGLAVTGMVGGEAFGGAGTLLFCLILLIPAFPFFLGFRMVRNPDPTVFRRPALGVIVRATWSAVPVFVGIHLWNDFSADNRANYHYAQIRSDLRAIAAAQDSLFKASGTYAPTVEELRVVLTSGVHIQMESGGNGWAATGYHVEGPDHGCAVWAGEEAPLFETPGGSRPDSPSYVYCDG